MDRLPVELLAKIAQKSDKKELLALSTVNSLFRNVAQADLYKRIHLHTLDVHKIPEDLHAAGFAQTIENRPELASLCRTFLYCFGPHCTWGTKGAHCSMFAPLSQLHHFSNLRNIQLHGFTINAKLRSAIRLLPRLRCVAFTGCEIVETCNLDQDGPSPSSQLEMSISRPSSNVGWDTIAVAGLRGLTLSVIDRVDPILCGLTSQGQVHSLDTLCIECDVFDNIVSFLESTPRLRCISIHGPVADPLHPIFSLPKDAIPMLHDFTGPPEYCATFINGRPVKSVEITSKGALISIPTNVLLSLRTSSVAIERLDLGLNIFATDFSHIPHTLQWLNLMVPICEEKLLEWAANALCNMHDLHVLECEMRASLTMPTISVLAEKCPSLRTILADVQKVREKWRKCGDGRWHRYSSE